MNAGEVLDMLNKVYEWTNGEFDDKLELVIKFIKEQEKQVNGLEAMISYQVGRG